MHTEFDNLPEPLQQQANEICNKFEAAWKQGARPRIQDFLDQCGELDRQTMLRLLIPLDVDYRRLAGDSPTEAEYCDAFPDNVSTIRQALAAYVPDGLQSSGPGATDHRVLQSLGRTLDAVPCVALRDATEEGSEPIVQPKSPEIPDRNSDSRYRLDGEIARGGMGAILKGRDTDLGRDLAIKVLLDEHKMKPEVIQRFVEEAQIGGQLQHPGIAPVYELGQFADQRPFFSMKLVKGKTLSALLAARENPGNDRTKFLGIFEHICQTMAYTHSRGVIHRDLKPANIMVGAFGEVQVMDWGLAKVLAQGGVADEKKASETQHAKSIIQTIRSRGSDTPASFGSDTQMGSVMGTPAYMAPEQALGEVDRLDERSDVFGLGAILCEILTGQPPYVGADGREVFRLASRGKLDECFERLAGCGAEAELVEIIRDCLALELEDRLPNACVVSERVTGYLQSVEQRLRQAELDRIEAETKADEERKRRKVVLAMAASVLLAMILGLGGVSWQWSRAETNLTAAIESAEAERLAKLDAKDQKGKAEQAAEEAMTANAQAQKRLEQISKANDILGSIFANLDPKEIAKAERPLQAILVENLDQAVEQLEGEAIGDPLVVAEMQLTFGHSLLGLGEPKKAIVLFEKSRDTRQSQLGADHPATLASMNGLAIAYLEAGNLNLGLPLCIETLEVTKAHFGPAHSKTLTAMNNLAGAYRLAGKFKLAIPLYEAALKLQKMQLGPAHPSTLITMSNLGETYREAGMLNLALPLNEETLKLRKAELGPAHPHTFLSVNNLALSYYASGRLDLALPLLEETLKLVRAQLGPDHPNTLTCMHNLGVAYRKAGKLDLALPLLERTLKLRKSMLGPDHPQTLTNMGNLALAHKAAGRLDLAQPLLEEDLKRRRIKLGPNHPDTLSAMTALAGVYSRMKQVDKSIPLYEDALKRHEARFGREHPYTETIVGNLGANYREAGRLEEAIALLEEAVRLSEKHPRLLVFKSSLRLAYLKAKRKKDFARMVDEQLTAARPKQEADSVKWASLLAVRSLDLLQLGDFPKAETLLRECFEIRKKTMPDSWLTFNTQSMLGGALLGQQKYNDAQPLLLVGYTGLKQHMATIPPAGLIRVAEAVDRLIQLCQTLDQPDEVSKWQTERAAPSVRAHELGKRGNWREAAKLMQEALPDHGGNAGYWLWLQYVCIFLDEKERIHANCDEMLRRFGDTDDPGVAHAVALACLLVPDRDITEQVRRLADLAAAGRSVRHVHHRDLGMLQYRQGEFEEADKRLNLAIAGGSSSYAVTFYYLAMVRHKRGDESGAKQVLRAAEDYRKRIRAGLSEDNFGDNWYEWLLIEAVRREANAVLGAVAIDE